MNLSIVKYSMVKTMKPSKSWTSGPSILVWALLFSGALAASGFEPGYREDPFETPPQEFWGQDPLQAIGKRNLVRLSKFSESYNDESTSLPQGWPAEGVASSRYGWRISPFSSRPQFHRGIDITNLPGTPVFATAAGTVAFSGWKSGYGYLVIVDHGNGYQSCYGHNSEVWAKEGMRVNRGQILAFMGSSGDSTGSHIHYEIWKNGRPVNPWALMGGDILTHMAGIGASLTNKNI